MAGVTLRLGVQTATRNRSVACDDCRFIGTKEYTAAYPMVSSELQNSKMRLAAISVQNLCGIAFRHGSHGHHWCHSSFINNRVVPCSQRVPRQYLTH